MARIGAGSASADIAVVCDDSGVWAWAPGWRLTLAQTRFDWCLLDPYADLIWGAKDTRLYALDLQGKAAPTLIATQWPISDDGDAGARKINLSYSSGFLSLRADQERFSVSLNVETKEIEITPEMNLNDEEFAAVGARITLVNKASLTQWAARARARAAAKRARRGHPSADALPEDPKGLCGAVEHLTCAIEDCEHAPSVPRTTTCLVTIWESCHDGCDNGYALYDPIKQAFLYDFNPEEEGEPYEYPAQQAPFPVSDTLAASPSGQYVISSYVLSDWKRTILEQGALGWLNLLRVKVNPQVDEARRKEVLRGVQRRARATRDFKTSAPTKPAVLGP
ncbi:MAG: hypothetical protein VYD19_10690 [Myxococcota bacterium]|nr:hypothetical protein [Myxococcota bacterium]